MKKTVLLSTSLLLAAVSSLALTNVVNAADAKSGSKEILLDNEKVQAVRLVYPPNTESGVHTHEFASRTIYVVKGGKLALVSEQGKVKEVTLKTGQMLYVPGSTHNVKNIGKTEVVLIETELK